MGPSTPAVYGSVRFAEKTSRNIVPADSLGEKNTAPVEKINGKVRIIRQANMTYSLDYNLGLYMVHALNEEHLMGYSLDYNCARISFNFQTTYLRESYPTSSHVGAVI